MALEGENRARILAAVRGAIEAAAARRAESVTEFFISIVRTAIDEVLDGPRTGRISLTELSGTEQTYIGTKIEIIVRDRLQALPGKGADAIVAGISLEIKWSKSLQWMIGPENVGVLCLGIGTERTGQRASAGLFFADRESLRAGPNRDGKTSLTAAAIKAKVDWLVREAHLRQNPLTQIPTDVLARIQAQRTAQGKLHELGKAFVRQPVPRDVIETVLGNRDPLRRLRRDVRRTRRPDEIVWLTSKYDLATFPLLQLPAPPDNCWVPVFASDLRARKESE